jgi:hypothetical protein
MQYKRRMKSLLNKWNIIFQYTSEFRKILSEQLDVENEQLLTTLVNAEA